MKETGLPVPRIPVDSKCIWKIYVQCKLYDTCIHKSAHFSRSSAIFITRHEQFSLEKSSMWMWKYFLPRPAYHYFENNTNSSLIYMSYKRKDDYVTKVSVRQYQSFGLSWFPIAGPHSLVTTLHTPNRHTPSRSHVYHGATGSHAIILGRYTGVRLGGTLID